MRKTIALLCVVIFSVWTSGILFSQQNKEDEKFQKILDECLDALWKFYPTSATMAGFHKYDDKLEDLSKRNLEKRQEELDKFNQEFIAKVDKLALSPEFQIDHEVIVGSLEMELMNHENLVPWAYNPIFYNEIFNNCVRSLVTGTFGSAEERAKNATERLKDLPKLIKQAQESLDTPPQLYTETAIKQFPGILEFYKNELPQLIESMPGNQKGKLQSELGKAVSALEEYQNYLTNELLTKSTGNFRLGEAHRRLARIAFQNDIPLEELLARARADVNNLRREMFLVCISFYKIMDPKFNVEQPPPNLTEEQVKNAVISHVLDKIKGEHATQDQFIEKIKNTTEEVKQFVQENQLIDLPENNLSITAMPPENQGVSWTRLIKPGPYEVSEEYTLQISPLSEALSEEETQSLLEEYNDFLLPFYIIRNVYPGQFIPFLYANKHSSLLQKLHPNMPLIKGWSIFVEEILIKAGFGNYDLRLRLNQLKMRLKVVLDFNLELNIHQGGMTKDQAIAYMTRTGFQTQAEAERNWNRIILNPGDAAYAYIGFQELLDMERAYREKTGAAFSKKEFLAKVLSYGTISIRHLKRTMAEESL